MTEIEGEETMLVRYNTAPGDELGFIDPEDVSHVEDCRRNGAIIYTKSGAPLPTGSIPCSETAATIAARLEAALRVKLALGSSRGSTEVNT